MEISRDILFGFFNYEVSAETCARIMEWANESPENALTLERERRLFDVISLSDAVDQPSTGVKKKSVMWKIVSVAASIAAILTISVFILDQHRGPDKVAGTTVSAPAGARSNVILPDGTEVWLNAGSTIKYAFSDKRHGQREISLDGQARFDVTKDGKHPFIVHTYLADVKVLGTSFDVIADKNDGIFEVALFEGKVDVLSPDGKGTAYTLSPSQRLSLSGDRLSVAEIEDYEVYRWTSGLYCFKDRAFSQIVNDMEYYYGSRITCDIDPWTAQEKLTGKFRVGDGLESALKVLQISLDFKYTIDNDSNTVHISSK